MINMNIQTRKYNAIEFLISNDDTVILSEIENIIKISKIQNKKKLHKFSEEEYKARASRAIQDIETGNMSKIEDLEQEIETW